MISLAILFRQLPPSSILVLCFLLHTISDFNLQGILASFKQKKWWKKNCPDPLYAGDYKINLAVHGISWTALTFLPFCWSSLYLPAVFVNGVVHSLIDHLKANKRAINLTKDQFLHFFQISATCFILSSN